MNPRPQMKQNWLALLLLLLPLQARALSLDEVVSQVGNHPRIDQAQWEAKQAKAERTAQSWLPDPKGLIEFEEVPFDRKNLRNADMINFGVSQEIPFPTTLITKGRIWDAEYKARQAMATGTVRSVAFEAKKTYFELVANQNQLSAKETILNAYKRMITSLESRYQSQLTSLAPTATTLDSMGTSSSSGDESQPRDSNLSGILMARMKKAEVEAEIHDLHHAHHALEAKLNLLMGRDPHAPLGDLKQPPLKILKEEEHALHQKVLAQNSDLEALKWRTKRAGREASLAAQNLIPTVEPQFKINQRENQTDAYTLGVQFNVPLWVHRNAAEIRAAQAGKKAAQSALAAGERDVLTEYYYLANHAQQHYQIVQKYQKEILPLGKSSVNIDQVNLSASIISPVRILQNLINYHEAITMYWNMWSDYQTEYAALEQLVGENL